MTDGLKMRVVYEQVIPASHYTIKVDESIRVPLVRQISWLVREWILWTPRDCLRGRWRKPRSLRTYRFSYRWAESYRSLVTDFSA